MAGGRTFDITARSLLLAAGMYIPPHSFTDNGYVTRLALDDQDLERMRGTSILDVGCGVAIFCSEMAVLYGATTAMVDLHPNHITPAIPAGQRRYTRSMLYLAMLGDMAALGRANVAPGAGPLNESICAHLPEILDHYGDDDNAPRAGDVFYLAATAPGPRRGGWDHVSSR